MRSGVFLCECGGSISEVLDLEALSRLADAEPGVASVLVESSLCKEEGRRLIEYAVEERGLDRLVIGACSRRVQGSNFERLARELRLADGSVQFANLREGCSVPHRDDPERAQSQAELMLAGAIALAGNRAPEPAEEMTLRRSVMVVGAGIAGLSAAEELSESGIEVHLVEKQQSIGGYMSRLSKTFPTEDCAMCSLLPRLDAALAPGVQLHALTEVTEISGEAGDFRVKLKTKPRFVTDACVGCDKCTPACPVTMDNEFNFAVSQRKAIWKPFANAVPSTFAIDQRGWAPCKAACPVHTSVQGYVALAAEGRFDEAYRLAAEPNPFPSVCGRICTHECETACTRSRLDEPVAIASLKRFVADRVAASEPVEKPALKFTEKVAVVGAGPAGLTAARELAQLGYKATVFEALPVAGGMLRAGIPEYRLPRDVLGAEVERIVAHGVELKLNQRCGEDFTVGGLMKDGYSAVFLATGLQKSAAVEVPGKDINGVVPAVELLRELNLGRSVRVGERVVVIGGGDVAMDAARSAVRLQAARRQEPQVTLAYRRTREEMPAADSEIEEAFEEGLRVEYLVVPEEIVGTSGKVASIKLQRCELGEPDATGRRRPVPIPGEIVEIEVDTVIFAVGQDLVGDFLAGCEGVEVERGQIVAERETLMTSRAGVFAGGDAAAAGSFTAIEAIAAGRRAARSIHNFLRGEQLLEVWDAERPQLELTDEELRNRERVPRLKMPALEPKNRIASWEEVQLGFSEEDAVAGAKRCLNCGGCSECKSCVSACPANAIDFSQQEFEQEISVGAVIVATGHKEFDAARKKPLGYGRFANVITQSQLARLVSAEGPTQGKLVRPSDGTTPKKILMLQCVGSRDCTSSGNEHCSTICCLFATLHASLIKQHDPEAEVTVAFTDLRAPGKAHEEYYRLVQERGVRYLRGRTGELMEEPDGSLRARIEDTVRRSKSEELYDLVVLSAGLEGSAGTSEIARVFGLAQNAAGFIAESQLKLRPIETARPGIFVAGTAQGPKSIPDTIAQAKAAAASAFNLLNGAVTTPAVEVAHCDEELCIGCGLCEVVCNHGAVDVFQGHAVVKPIDCQGCGDCAAECPSGAMTLRPKTLSHDLVDSPFNGPDPERATI